MKPNYDLEKIKQVLIDTLMSRQRSVEVENVTFELLPVLERNTPTKRAEQAEKEAERLIQILIND